MKSNPAVTVPAFRKASICGRWLTLALTLSATQARADAASWSPTPAPVLNPGSIKVFGGRSLGPGSTIMMVGNAQVSLSAIAEDKDTKTIDSTTSLVLDSTQIEWSKTGGNLSVTRTDSAQNVTFTAPNVPEGSSSVTVTVTAKPDDNTTQDPGNLPTGDTGNRNDAPGSGVTLTIIVIKDCPSTIGVSTTCTLENFASYWPAGPRSFGYLVARMAVSGGGPPPNPPNNWNGLLIREVVILFPNDEGSAVAADFNGGVTPANFCMGSTAGFIVGTAGTDLDTCQQPAADDSFWDRHADGTTISLLKAGTADKTVKCQQKYFCGPTTVPLKVE